MFIPTPRWVLEERKKHNGKWHLIARCKGCGLFLPRLTIYDFTATLERRWCAPGFEICGDCGSTKYEVVTARYQSMARWWNPLTWWSGEFEVQP